MKASALFVTTLAAALLAGAAQAAVTVTYENPGVLHTTATFDVVGEENFNARPTGTGGFNTTFGGNGVITGTYSATTQVHAPDVYGGEAGTNYAVTFNEAGYALDLFSTTDPNGVTYFGYYLPALDGANILELYSHGNKVFTFTQSTILAAIGSNPAYFGKPDDPLKGGNGGEAYVFVNFYSDSAFDRVVFKEVPAGGGYESDNHTVGYFKQKGGNGIPEPSSWALMILGMGFAGATLRTRRRMALAG